MLFLMLLIFFAQALLLTVCFCLFHVWLYAIISLLVLFWWDI